MKAEIVGKNLVITLPLNNPPILTSTKKSMMVASTGGPQDLGVTIDGKEVKVSVNAYYKAR